MNRDLLMSRLRDLVREWDAETGYRLQRLARVQDYFPLPLALTAWTIDYSAQDRAGKQRLPYHLQVSRVTTGIGRTLVSAVEDLQLEAGIVVQEIWVGGLLYRGAARPVSSFGARWIQGSDRVTLSVPA